MAINRITNPNQLQIRILKQGQVDVTKAAASNQSNQQNIATPQGINFFVDVYVVFNGNRVPTPHYEVDSSTGVVTQDFYSFVFGGFLTLLFNTYTAPLTAQQLTYTFEYIMYEVVIS